MSAQMGRKSVILFYASLRGLLTLKRQHYGLYTDGESYHRTVAKCGCDRCLLSRLTGLSREPSTSQGERARRVVETAVGTRTCSKDAREEQQRRRRERQRERLAAETDAQTERRLSQRRQRDRTRRAAQTARYAILSQRYSPSLERHSMEPPPSQMTVLGWTDVAAIGF